MNSVYVLGELIYFCFYKMKKYTNARNKRNAILDYHSMT